MSLGGVRMGCCAQQAAVGGIQQQACDRLGREARRQVAVVLAASDQVAEVVDVLGPPLMQQQAQLVIA